MDKEIHYRDGYYEQWAGKSVYGKNMWSRIEMADGKSSGLMRGDKWSNQEEGERRFKYFLQARFMNLTTDLNLYLLGCKRLFAVNPGQSVFHVKKEGQYAGYAQNFLKKLVQLQISAKDEVEEIHFSAITDVISTTGTPLYKFDRSFILICSNLPSLKYLERDYARRISRLVDSLSPTESEIMKRVGKIARHKIVQHMASSTEG